MAKTTKRKGKSKQKAKKKVQLPVDNVSVPQNAEQAENAEQIKNAEQTSSAQTEQVTQTVESINKVLEMSGENIENIDMIIPHQSNQKIMKAITSRLKIEEEKMYTNIQNVRKYFLCKHTNSTT